MKGRTTQPLVIEVHDTWAGHSAIAALRAAGHKVRVLNLVDADLILHPAAHNWSEPMFQEQTRTNGTAYRPYLDAAITAARRRKRGKA